MDFFSSKEEYGLQYLKLVEYDQQPIGKIAKQITVSYVQGYVIESFFLLAFERN